MQDAVYTMLELALTIAKHASVTLFHMCSLKSKSSRVMKCIQVTLSEHSGGFREGTKRRGTGQSDGSTVIHAASSCYKSRPLSSSFVHAAAVDSVQILLNIFLPNNYTKVRLDRRRRARPNRRLKLD